VKNEIARKGSGRIPQFVRGVARCEARREAGELLPFLEKLGSIVCLDRS